MHLPLTSYYFMRHQLIGATRENSIVLLGAQGPSVFFYGFSFLREDAYVDDPCFSYYSLLINSNVFDVFKLMFSYIDKETNSDKKNVLLLYVRGYLNAYTLLRNTQPYIIYFGGYEQSSSPWNQFALNRYSLETRLDILYELAIKESTSFKSMFRVARDDISIISEMFYNLAIDAFSLPNITKKTFTHAYQNMKRRLMDLNSESASLPKMVLSLMKKPQVNVFFRSKRVTQTDKYDFLNLRKKVWQHPSAGTPIDITFLDLINEAKEEIVYINAILKDFNNGKTIDTQLKEYIMDLNYSGLVVGTEPKHFDLIFRDEEDGKRPLN